MDMLMCYVQCCECRDFIDVKETSAKEATVSHGLCKECFDKAMAGLEADGAEKGVTT